MNAGSAACSANFCRPRPRERESSVLAAAAATLSASCARREHKAAPSPPTTALLPVPTRTPYLVQRATRATPSPRQRLAAMVRHEGGAPRPASAQRASQLPLRCLARAPCSRRSSVVCGVGARARTWLLSSTLSRAAPLHDRGRARRADASSCCRVCLQARLLSALAASSALARRSRPLCCFGLSHSHAAPAPTAASPRGSKHTQMPVAVTRRRRACGDRGASFKKQRAPLKCRGRRAKRKGRRRWACRVVPLELCWPAFFAPRRARLGGGRVDALAL